MEDYLEAIASLKKDKVVARVKDIGSLLNVKNSSVTGALNFLSQEGYVIHERYGYVDLTPEGEKLAENVQKRHDMIKRFLIDILHIDHRIAEEDACKMEHAISTETLNKLTKFIEFVDTCPDGGKPDWLKSYYYYVKMGKRPKCKVRKMKKEMLPKV